MGRHAFRRFKILHTLSDSDSFIFQNDRQIKADRDHIVVDGQRCIFRHAAARLIWWIGVQELMLDLE